MTTIYALYEEGQPIRYVGLTRDLPRRLKQYQHANGGHNPHMKRWLRKVGDRLRHFILDEVPLERADAAEREWIARFREEGLDLLNYTSGGEGAFEVAEEVRNKVRAAALRRVAAGTHNFQNPVVRERQKAAAHKLKGRKLAPAHAASCRARCLAWAEKCRKPKPSTEERAAALADAKRRSVAALNAHRAVALAKSAEFRRGKPLTAEQRERVRVGQLASWTPERRAQMSAQRKGKYPASLAAYQAKRKQEV